jgi:hypothetical protein
LASATAGQIGSQKQEIFSPAVTIKTEGQTRTRKTETTTAANKVRTTRWNNCKQFSGSEKDRIVLQGLRGEETVTGLFAQEGISETVCYRWPKEFLEAGDPGKATPAASTSRPRQT